MEIQELERIAKAVLRELGAGDPPIRIAPDTHADRWRIEVGGSDPHTLIVRAGRGTTAHFVREQIFTQFSAR